MRPTRGVYQLRQRMSTFLSTNLPGLLLICRNEWDLQDWELPNPQEYAVYDPFQTKVFPSIGFTVSQDTDHNRVDYTDPFEIEYNVQYQTTLSVVVQTPKDPDTGKWAVPAFDESLRLRDDMTRVVQDLIKNQPDLGFPNDIRLEEGTLNTTYQTAVHPNSQTQVYVVGGVISVNIFQREYTYNPPIGTADTINVTTEVVAQHEEMP